MTRKNTAVASPSTARSATKRLIDVIKTKAEESKFRDGLTVEQRKTIHDVIDAYLNGSFGGYGIRRILVDVNRELGTSITRNQMDGMVAKRRKFHDEEADAR